MDKVVHFEIPFDNKNRATKFYKDIFGWDLIDIPDMGYVMVHAAQTDDDNMVTDKGAINGGLFQRNEDASAPIVVIQVASIDKTIIKVKESGGRLVTPKQSIPNGSYARVADCEGNVIGIIDKSK
jgi:predicted enzyme related to lactoylglutathione lyase